MLGLTVSKGTVLGQSGGPGVPAHGHVGWVSSRGSAPLSALGLMVHGVTTFWKETWRITSVTSSPAKVSKECVQHLSLRKLIFIFTMSRKNRRTFHTKFFLKHCM